jgi:hypothetical protein
VEAPVMEVTGDGKGTSGGGWRKMRRVWRAFGVRRSNRPHLKIVWHIDGTILRKKSVAV